MRSFLCLLALCALPVAAQQKKIVVLSPDPAIARELQSASSKVRVVTATRENVMQEIADADAFVGEPTPEMVRAGKNLQWVQVMSAGVERALHLSGGNDLRDSALRDLGSAPREVLTPVDE